MKLWLDDIRPAPEGWVHVKTAAEAISMFARGEVEIASLDHDLGTEETGYSVVCWIERAMYQKAWYGVFPTIYVHSSNPVGRMKMEKVIQNLEALK